MLEPFYQDHLSTVYNSDALKVLQTLQDCSVQMCMTSPPYWGLRNYAGGADTIWGDNHCNHEWLEDTQGLQHENRNNLIGTQEEVRGKTGTAFIQKYDRLPSGICTKCGAWRGQLGLEPTPELYVEHLMMIFREVKRVLRKDGSFYLNIGDTYWGGKGQSAYAWSTEHTDRDTLQKPYHQITGMGETRPQDGHHPVLKPKCMACIPERVLFAILEDGWILRNKIIWHKRNHMPGSQKDRFTQSWEYLYFFTKARKYYFDLDAVRVPHLSTHPSGNKERKIPFTHKGNLGHSIPWQPFNLRVRDVKRGKKGTSAQSGELKASEQEVEGYEYPESHHGSPMNNQDRLHRDRRYNSKYFNAAYGQPMQGFQRDQTIIKARDQSRKEAKELFPNDPKKQQEYINDIHDHMTHPKGKNPGDIWSIAIRPSSISVCPKCETVFPRLLKVCPHCKVEGIIGHFAPYPETLCIGPIKASTKLGDIVLDCFAGGGTTGVAAKRLGRQAILIDCVRPYCVMARYKFQKIEYQPEIDIPIRMERMNNANQTI